MKINNLVKTIAISCLICASSSVLAMNSNATKEWIQTLRDGNKPLLNALNDSFMAAKDDEHCKQQPTFEITWNTVQAKFQAYTPGMTDFLRVAYRNQTVSQKDCLEMTRSTLLTAGQNWSIGLATWKVDQATEHENCIKAYNKRKEQIDSALAALSTNDDFLQEQEVLPLPTPEVIQHVRQEQIEAKTQEVGMGWKLLGGAADCLATSYQWMANHQHYPIKLALYISSGLSWFVPSCPWTVTIGLAATSITSCFAQPLADSFTTFAGWCRGKDLLKTAANTLTNGAVDQAEAIWLGKKIQ